MSSGVQHIRLRRPEPKPAEPKPARHSGILQDQLRRAQRRPWTPSFSLAIRVFMLIRIAGAMYSNIDDCDEAICVFAEAKFYRTVTERINERVGRYLFFMLLVSAGMWNASSAFLPSSFAMYMTMFAFSYALERPSVQKSRRTLLATLSFATGAIVGWPFALALAIPFVFEELFVYGADVVSPEAYQSWIVKRWKSLFVAGFVAALIFVPVVGLDSLAYGKLTIVPWNIVRYNIFGGAERGPELYGTSPWNYYFLNLVLNFNILVPLSLLALPALAVTYFVDRKRLGLSTPSANESSPFTILTVRLLPFYVWIGILTLQAHKEERFMFPAYPLLCFNAAVTLYLMRGWQEALFIKVTRSPYRASQSMLFARFTLSVIAATSTLSFFRIMALWEYYHAPMTVVWALETKELPRLLNTTGLLPTYSGIPEDEQPRIDLSPVKHFDLTLCVGKEWHRFPGNYLVPDGVAVEFIKNEFDGLLPGHFKDVPPQPGSSSLWLRPGTQLVRDDQNDLNKEELSHYVPVETCDYLIDLDFPLHPVESPLEPRYAVDDKNWERVFCRPFLDARHSRLLTRAFWIPGEAWQSNNEFGDYCLLKNKALVNQKEAHIKHRVAQGEI
ncbi:hypothetical protein DXG03_008471 [Asterophora parasitica]|uniref:Mannosyltransferase n=1 Tax=Asterophora parasitica TaxID=117018 RepID=A0A9P7GFL5_9AGAR|nr:hypothetical protein DXG03_008471 [Asterophora parasitica]